MSGDVQRHRKLFQKGVGGLTGHQSAFGIRLGLLLASCVRSRHTGIRPSWCCAVDQGPGEHQHLFCKQGFIRKQCAPASHWWHSWVAVMQTMWHAESPLIPRCAYSPASLWVSHLYIKHGLKGSCYFSPAPKAVLSRFRSICVENQWTNSVWDIQWSDVRSSSQWMYILTRMVCGEIAIFTPDWHFAVVFLCYHIKIQKWGL